MFVADGIDCVIAHLASGEFATQRGVSLLGGTAPVENYQLLLRCAEICQIICLKIKSDAISINMSISLKQGPKIWNMVFEK